MKCIFWNIRGLANSPSKLALKRLILKNKPSFVFIAEPWMDVNSFPQTWLRRLNLKVFAVNNRGNLLPNLWCLCLDHLNPEVIDLDDQQISFIFDDNGQVFGLSAIYASTNYIKRKNLWHKLSLIQNDNAAPWCFIGDFNSILGSHEHRGIHSPATAPMNDFHDWTDSNSLVHLPTRGMDFTWNNGRRGSNHTERRLDRSICNLSFIDTCSTITCSTLTKTRSDHFPILLDFLSSEAKHVSQFKFMAMWLLHPDCMNVVKDCWNTTVIGCPMFVLNKKLKILKEKLKIWNKDVFGNVHNHLKLAEDKVNSIQSTININGHSDSLMELGKQAQIELELALTMEKAFWKEKSKVKWCLEGDRNAKYFHRVTKIKTATKLLTALRNGDNLPTNSDDIAGFVVQHYTNLFESSNVLLDDGLIE
jgi:hypothetical protein